MTRWSTWLTSASKSWAWGRRGRSWSRECLTRKAPAAGVNCVRAARPPLLLLPVSPQHSPAGSGPYGIVRKLGGGGMAAVFLGGATGRAARNGLAAVKVMLADLGSRSSSSRCSRTRRSSSPARTTRTSAAPRGRPLRPLGYIADRASSSGGPSRTPGRRPGSSGAAVPVRRGPLICARWPRRLHDAAEAQGQTRERRTSSSTAT